MQRAILFRIWAALAIAGGIGLLIIFGPLLAIPLSFALGGGAGVQTGRCFTCLPEARKKCLIQLALVAAGTILCVYVGGLGGFGGLAFVLAAVGFVMMLVVRNMSSFGASGLVGLLDRQDWTPGEEEIALRPVRLLIDKDNFRQALGELEELLKTRKPTYEALLLKAKLLHHVGRVDEARTALLGLIGLSHSTPQQLAVMEMLAFLDENNQESPRAPASGTRRIEIGHDLILFRTSGDDPPLQREIPPGSHEVVEIVHRKRIWLKLSGEDFGNAAICWEAIPPVNRPSPAPPNKGFLSKMAMAIRGKSRRQLRAESRDFFREANEFLRRDDWHSALPLLQKAAAADPDRFEIAYSWVKAARQTGGDPAAAEAVARVLQQSQWSKSEEEMFKQLKRPFVK